MSSAGLFKHNVGLQHLAGAFLFSGALQRWLHGSGTLTATTLQEGMAPEFAHSDDLG
jgi:hypothetical protein